MPYPFTAEQRRLRETLRTFALEEVIPGAAERVGPPPAGPVAAIRPDIAWTSRS